MAFLRGLVLLLLLACVALFACFAVTGELRYRRLGLAVLKWTLVGAFGFFAVLVLERIA